ncbi:MAG: hypothetical protein VX615_04450 [Planctomycetota bacterium]|nr:hypothetical protein [Planctomycetota bacterium]
MFRFLAIVSIVMMLVSPASSAAPPSQDNWWQTMDRYTGKWRTKSKGYREPTQEFQNEWVEPRKLQHYSSQSIGNAPRSNMTGFVRWSKDNDRIEWSEVTDSELDGRQMSTGFCINSTPKTVTWIVSVYGEEGFVRQFSMVDTFDEGGLTRSITLLRGEDLERQTTSWIPVE